jgi:hypothetical protein
MLRLRDYYRFLYATNGTAHLLSLHFQSSSACIYSKLYLYILHHYYLIPYFDIPEKSCVAFILVSHFLSLTHAVACHEASIITIASSQQYIYSLRIISMHYGSFYQCFRASKIQQFVALRIILQVSKLLDHSSK